MSKIELKERKPTWNYMLNDLAFISLKTRVLYGIFDNQDRFDFEYQIELREKEIERLNNIINELEKTLLEWHEYWEDDDSYRWQYKNAYDYLQELKGSDKE